MLYPMFRILFFLSSFSFIACKEYKVREIKDFRLYVNSEDKELRDAIVELADQFNKDVGGKALTVVENKKDSNSEISFVENLSDAGGTKLGLGQWITTEHQRHSVGTYGAQKQVIVHHSMALEFDTANFLGKLAGMKDKTSDEYKHLYHLFCHEVGHGMKLDHSNDKASVMYKSIPDRYTRTIDFNGFFSYVRTFLQVKVKDSEEAPAPKDNLI